MIETIDIRDCWHGMKNDFFSRWKRYNKSGVLEGVVPGKKRT
ncbi:hypothetical protein B4098_1768 [Heyndrickxia coagulans]|jgi:hypothetical protein|uniref:Uncharacterized protein n=1 Tax=Heyndrickxia coagulans TaxID=1398 RepID=A0A150K2U3_HEYCO|nr:hypothetical protein HMPREF3213_00148 [Heyndrickxia coagulans]KYC63910.1 hypothetical protein B4098_1768 [Heyndrickxia coagulans]